jgi:DNA-directed RNA polymerase specialized sigma24 family protein
LDGLKYREVAKELNLSMKTIEAQVSKALKQLRIELGHQQYLLN